MGQRTLKHICLQILGLTLVTAAYGHSEFAVIEGPIMDTSEERSDYETYERRNLFVYEARSKATTLSSKARQNSRSKAWQNIYQKVTVRLGKIEILWSNGAHDFLECQNNPRWLAYNYPPGHKVFLCRRVFQETDWFGLPELSQTLLHETAHSMGYRNECHATRIERNIMRVAGLKPAYDNAYVDPCALE